MRRSCNSFEDNDISIPESQSVRGFTTSIWPVSRVPGFQTSFHPNELISAAQDQLGASRHVGVWLGEHEKKRIRRTFVEQSEGPFPNLNCHVQSGRVEEGQSKAVLFSESHSTSSDLQGAALETSTLDEIMPPAWSLLVDNDTRSCRYFCLEIM
jgi:hypothetical protein